jgi:hypothetical protein
MPFTSETGSPLLPVPTQPLRSDMGDFDTHEGHDPKLEEEVLAKKEAEASKPQEKKPTASPHKDSGESKH